MPEDGSDGDEVLDGEDETPTESKWEDWELEADAG